MSKMQGGGTGPRTRQAGGGGGQFAEPSWFYEGQPYWSIIQVTEFELLYLPDEGRDIDEDGTALHFAWETWEIVEEWWWATVERCHLCACGFDPTDFEGLKFGVHEKCAEDENLWAKYGEDTPDPRPY